MKKIFTLGLTLFMGLQVFGQSEPSTSEASQNPLDFVDNGITYTILDDQAKTCMTKAGESRVEYDPPHFVTVYGNTMTGDVSIPATVTNPDTSESYTVVAIGSYGFNNASSVTIAEGVTTINQSAFALNQNLSQIVIPNSVTTIGSYAFSGCINLTTITLPETLTTIANNTFVNSGLTSITIPESVIYIGDFAFSGCKGLQSCVLPDNVLQIGSYSFQNCTALTNVTLSENLSSIPPYAFAGCSQLPSINIPAGVTSIGDNAFRSCASLKEITCYNKSIPAISYSSFSSAIYSDAVLKVYNSALNSYKKSTLWSNFKNIEPIQVDPTGVVLTPSTLTLNVGTSGQLTAVLTPEEAIGEIAWSVTDMSVDGCLSIDETGKVIGRKIGTATVIASCGQLSATCNVVVNSNSSEKVTVTPLTQDIYVGDNVTMTATVFPSTITPSIVWASSNESVATIDATTGVLTALAPGATVITATNDNIIGKLAVTIYEVVPTDITLDQTSLSLEVGGQSVLKATVMPENVTYPTVTWESSDPNVAIVSEGTVTAVGVGSANIRAMCGGVTANCEVTVNPTPATSVTLSQASATLKVSQTLQLAATVGPENATDKSIQWVSDNSDVAIVSEEGVVAALKVGTANITATCGSVSAVCQITVEPTPSEGVLLNAAALTLKVNQTQQLAATVLPEDTTDKNVSWSSSDSNVATVENGLVTAVKPGSATITATNGSYSASCAVTVDPILAEQVILDQSNIIINVGNSATITPSVLPADTTDPSIEWASTEPGVASVANGVVTAVSPGSTVITASCGNAVASCNVTVLQPATSISLNETELTLEVGDLYDLIETVEPANTTDITYWTSSEINVATVDENGIITAIKGGTTTITATCGQKSAQCTVTVKDIAAESVTLSENTLTLLEGQTSQLSATVMPEDTTNPTVVWTSSDETVATVAADGSVTAIKEGTAIIIATCGEVSAQCNVTVEKPVEDQFYLNQTSGVLKAEGTLQLEATYVTTSATQPSVEWTTSNSKVATVSDSGLVTAVAVGSATITASCNGKTATCDITVEPTPAEWVTLSSTDVTIKLNETVTLTATVYPSTTTDDTVVWSSSNNDIATVDDGVITGVAEGTAVITATCGSVFASCVVSVTTDTPGAIYEIATDLEADSYNVFNLQGVNVMNTKIKTDLTKLPSGIYIINGKKVMIKK